MNSRRRYKRGARQPLSSKLTFGVLVVLLLLLIVLGPFAMFSSFGSILSKPNGVVSVAATLSAYVAPTSATAGATFSLLGAFPLGTISRFELQPLPPSDPILTETFNFFSCWNTPLQNSSACGYAYLLGEWTAQYYRVRLVPEADMQWQINVRACGPNERARGCIAAAWPARFRARFQCPCGPLLMCAALPCVPGARARCVARRTRRGRARKRHAAAGRRL